MFLSLSTVWLLLFEPCEPQPKGDRSSSYGVVVVRVCLESSAAARERLFLRASGIHEWGPPSFSLFYAYSKVEGNALIVVSYQTYTLKIIR